VTLDAQGNLYTDQGFDAGQLTVGKVVEYAASSSGDAAPVLTINAGVEDLDPFVLATDSSGNLYTASPQDNEDPGGVRIFAPGSFGSVAPIATLTTQNVTSVAVDGTGRIFVSTNPRIPDGFGPGALLVYAPGSRTGASPIASIPSLGNLQLMAVDAAGKIFVEFTYGNIRIYKLDGHGGATQVGSIIGSFTGLGNITGMTVDKQDRLIVVGDNSVNIYAPGASGNVAPVASIQSTRQVLVGGGDAKVDASGNIFTNGVGPNGAGAFEFNPVNLGKGMFAGLAYRLQPAFVTPYPEVIFPLAVSPSAF
jgi:hypothetical protein